MLYALKFPSFVVPVTYILGAQQKLSDLKMRAIKNMEDYHSSGSNALRLYFAWSLSHFCI